LPTTSTLSPYTTLFRSQRAERIALLVPADVRSKVIGRELVADELPLLLAEEVLDLGVESQRGLLARACPRCRPRRLRHRRDHRRSEEHTSELQSRENLV